MNVFYFFPIVKGEFSFFDNQTFKIHHTFCVIVTIYLYCIVIILLVAQHAGSLN